MIDCRRLVTLAAAVGLVLSQAAGLSRRPSAPHVLAFDRR